MKQNIFTLALLSVFCCMFFVGCEKENDYNTIITIRASDEKTLYNSSDGSVVWEEDEEISVVRGNSSLENPFTTFVFNGMVDGSATFRGTIPESLTSGNYYAIYPAQDNLSVANGLLSCEVIPTMQTLCEGSFDSGNNTSVGYNSTTTMRFFNVGGLAKLALRGSTIVSSIKIIDNTSGHFLSGRGTIDVMDEDLPIEWSEANSLNYIVANAPSDGLSVNGGTIVYLVLPPCTMTDYTLIITDTDGHENRINCTDPVTISRAKVTMLGAFEIHDGPYDNQFWYTASSQLEGFEIGSSAWDMTVTGHVFGNGQGVVSFSGSVHKVPIMAFRENSALRSITLPSSDTLIESLAFLDCPNLQSVTMDYVRTISSAAFEECSNLTSVQMSRVRSVGGVAFYECDRLKSVYLPQAVFIGEKAFSCCDSLTSAYIPNVTILGVGAFSQDPLLSSVIMPNVTTIEIDAFFLCPSLTSVNLPNVTSIGLAAFANSGLTTINLPKIKTIDADAFANTYLQSVILGPDLESIDEYGFYVCINLANIYCHTTAVPSLGSNAFNLLPSTAVLHVPSGMGDDYAGNTDWSDVFGTSYGTGTRILEDL